MSSERTVLSATMHLPASPMQAPPMERQQEEHLSRIKSSFQTLVDAKYRKGQAEHGGDLHLKGTLSLIDFAIDEAIDQVVYLLTIKEQLTR